MKSLNITNVSAFLVSVTLLFALIPVQEKQKQESATDQTSEVQAADSEQVDFAPVDNMHHFMEYICEPSYKGLKKIMAKEPENRKQWKAFKNHSLVLAETSALVATRGPKDDEEKSAHWKQLSLDVYHSGKLLYKSAGKFEEAQKHYSTLIDNCNKCHTSFAGGKYQLKK